MSSLLATLQEYILASNIILHVEPGYLGSFIYRYVKPDAQRARFDYMFFILDDIELSENFHMTTWLECYRDNDLDVLSPSVAEPGTSQLIMKIPEPYKSAGSERGAVRRVNFCEFFCYLMTEPPAPPASEVASGTSVVHRGASVPPALCSTVPTTPLASSPVWFAAIW